MLTACVTRSLKHSMLWDAAAVLTTFAPMDVSGLVEDNLSKGTDTGGSQLISHEVCKEPA